MRISGRKQNYKLLGSNRGNAFIRLLSQSFQPNGHCFDCCSAASKVRVDFLRIQLCAQTVLMVYFCLFLLFWRFDAQRALVRTASVANSLLFKLVAVEIDSLSLSLPPLCGDASAWKAKGCGRAGDSIY
jgi:hypothetical protein